MTQTENTELHSLINTILSALFGIDLARLGTDLHGPYRQEWEAIVAGVRQSLGGDQ
jgi:hypothetical protein